MKYLYFFLTILSLEGTFAQDSTLIELEKITVTANIITTDLRATGRNLSIISQKTIEASPVKTIEGILQYALNVDVRSRSAMGVQADISIRGGHYDQTLILLDGVKLNDPQTGHHSLNLPIPFSEIDRIEVLQGGASRVFGPSAFSGVINIISKKIIKNEGGLTAFAGTHALLGLGGSIKGTKNKNYGAINFELQQSDGHTFNTDFNRKVASLKVGTILKKGSLELMSGWFKNDFGASNFYHPKFFNQAEKVASSLANITWNHNFSNKLLSTFLVNYRTHHDEFDFDLYRANNRLNAVNFHKTGVWDAEWKFKYKNKFGTSAFGVEYRNEKVWSNRLGEIQQKPKPIKNEPSVFYTNFKNRENYSGFLEHQSQFENWLISAGTLLNYNTQFGFSVFPGADISYNLNAQNQIYFSGNRSLRFPTFTELYLNTATVKSDPNLLPEKASTFEMGYKNFSPILNTVVTVFYRKTTDAIDKIKRPENPVPTMENINNINMFGLEYSNIFNLKGWGNQKVIQNIILNYAYLKADRKEENFQSFYTLNYLSHKLNCGVETKPFSRMEWSLWYTLKIREGNYQWDNNSPILAYPKVNLFDTRFAYKIKKNRIFLDINNLFNLTYFEHGFVELPGRWISLGLNLNY